MPVDAVAPAIVRDELRRWLEDPWDGWCRHVVTLNPEYVMAARRNPAFLAAIAGADLVTADGVGVAVAAQWLGGGDATGVSRITGVDLAEWLGAESGPRRAPIFLLGAAPGIAGEAAAALRRRHPSARIAGTWSEGSAARKDDEPALARIGASGARAVLVAYGAPGQVIWIARNRAALALAGVRLAIGVGGTLDYLAERVPRAPGVVRRAGLEWLYRLAREPWRWRRQLVLPRFAVLVGLAWLWRRGNRARRWAKLMTPGRRATDDAQSDNAIDRGHDHRTQDGDDRQPRPVGDPAGSVEPSGAEGVMGPDDGTSATMPARTPG